MQDLEQIKREFLAECTDDYVGLWSLIRRIRFGLKQLDPQKVREITIALITELLEEGLIKAGIPKMTGALEEWRLSAERTVERIQDEWNKLGVEPNMGDIVWFTTTEAGDIKAKEYQSAEMLASRKL